MFTYFPKRFELAGEEPKESIKSQCQGETLPRLLMRSKAPQGHGQALWDNGALNTNTKA